jgi:hypothetical protein
MALTTPPRKDIPEDREPMTQPAHNGDAARAFRARNALIRSVRTRLKGSGLDVRELARELVVSNPGHPDQGRVYITYAGAEVSLRRTTWAYLGYLDGHGPTDPGAEPHVGTDKIISMLMTTRPGAGGS